MTPRDTSIRPAVAADADALAALHKLAFTPSWSATEIAWMLDSPGLGLVAEDGNETIGFVLGRAVAGEAEVLTLAVCPDGRRRGVGSALLSRLLDSLRERRIAVLFLEVADDNAAALALYRRFGFVETARRRGYYARDRAPAADAIVMSKRMATEVD